MEFCRQSVAIPVMKKKYGTEHAPCCSRSCGKTKDNKAPHDETHRYPKADTIKVSAVLHGNRHPSGCVYGFVFAVFEEIFFFLRSKGVDTSTTQHIHENLYLATATPSSRDPKHKLQKQRHR